MPTITAIIPVHNGGRRFAQCLDALAASADAPDEVIVVDDGGTDGSADRARARGLRVVPSPRPASGPAAARNAAARHAAGDALLFIDADVAVHPDAVGRVRAFLGRHPEYDAVIGSYDTDPPEGNFPSQYKNLLQHYVHQEGSAEAFTFWGAIGAIRREAFESVGGFDAERYAVPAIEDIELGGRLRAAGRRIRMDKGLLATHLKRWTYASLLRSDFLRRALPWTRLILERDGLQDDLNIGRAARAKVVLSGLAALGLAASPLLGWPALAAAAAALALIAWMDRALLRWFAAQRGGGFAARAFAFHAFHHFYSGVAFALGLAQHLASRRRRRRGAAPLSPRTNP